MPLQIPTRSASSDRLVIAVTALLATAVLAVAAFSVALPAAQGPPSVDANVSDRYDSLDSFSATRTTAIERNGTVRSQSVYEATLAPGTGARRLRLVESGADRYDLRVSNGSSLWLHDRSRDTVTRIPLSRPTRAADTADRVQRLLLRSNLTTVGGASETPPAVEPLPVVPRERAPSATGPADGYAVSYVGTESVDGRETYVLRLTPRSNRSAAAYRQTLWLDAEWFYPLKRQTTWREDGTRTQLTTTYTNVTFNPPVPNGTFAPDIGPNTTVEPADAPETEVYRRLDALRSDASVTVPTPEVPASYELTYATRTEGRVHGVGLRYVNRTSRITVSMYNFTYQPGDRDERLSIDGRAATLSNGPTSSLSWNCDSYRYTVRGTGVTTHRLVTVAESVGCPT